MRTITIRIEDDHEYSVIEKFAELDNRKLPNLGYHALISHITRYRKKLEQAVTIAEIAIEKSRTTPYIRKRRKPVALKSRTVRRKNRKEAVRE